MKRDIIEIRSNINPMFNWLAQVEKDKEEREKAEREARWAKEKEEREEKERKWKEEHPILHKYTYISQWNYGTYCYSGDSVNYYFYEWSDIHREPRHFGFSIPFYRFLDDCKMNFCDDDNNKLKLNKTCYIVCKPGCSDLIICPTYDELKEEFERISSLSAVLSTVPEI